MTKMINTYSWRNSSGLKINQYWKFFSQKQTKFTHDWQFWMFLDNILHQNDSTWSPLLFRWSREIGVAKRGSYIYMTEIVGPIAEECVWDVCHIKEAIWIGRYAPNTMDRDKEALYLESCIWSSSGHAYFWWSSEQIKYHHSDVVCCPRTYETDNCE